MLSLLIGCSDKYNELSGLTPTLVPRYISVSPSDILFDTSLSGKKQINVISTNTPWGIDNNINWINISPLKGETNSLIDVVVDENFSGEDKRIGIIYLKSTLSDWKYETPITISQTGATPYINIANTEIELSGGSNKESVEITSNCSWDADCNSDWVTFQINNNVLTIETQANETNDYRTAIISIYNNGETTITSNIKLRQAPAKINASTDPISFDNIAGTARIQIEAESAWTASSSNSWIDIEPSSGEAGTSTVLIDVSDNTSTKERTGYLYFSIGGKTNIQIPIIQKGIYIEPEFKEILFNACNETKSLKVLSNTNWVVGAVPEWIEVTPKEGQNNGEIYLTAQENQSTSPKTGTLHLTQIGLDLDAQVTLNQKGMSFDVSESILYFEDKAETQIVNIEAEGIWNASTSYDWITIFPLSSKGNDSLSISVSENIDEKERIGEVLVSMYDKTIPIRIVQKGKYFRVSNDELNFTSKGGTLNIDITSNDKWRASVCKGDDWLVLSETEGEGNVTVTVEALDNPSMNKRTAEILFETNHSQAIKIIITQDSRFLYIDTQELLFYSKGGNSDPITIHTDGIYSIRKSDSWINITENNNVFTVSVDESKEQNPRVGYIIIALTDIQDGTMSVTVKITQLNSGGSFLRNNYGDDVNYDNNNSSTRTELVIKGYSNDKNYDSDVSSRIKLTITGFSNDKNWDSMSSSQAAISKNRFSSDKNYDKNP